jgi:AbrB family looped-hinge helix DNA binding protein
VGASYRSRVNSRGQLVIPTEIRKRWGFKPGTEVVFREDRGRLIIEPQTFAEIFKLQGALKDDLALKLLREERKRERERMKRLERL